MNNRYRGLALAVPFGIVAALFAAQANAAGFQLKEQSTEGLGNAFAGSTAKAYDTSTIFYNPAGMTRLKGNQAQQHLSYIAPKAEFKGTATTIEVDPTGTPAALPTQASTNGEQAGTSAFVPAAYAFWDYSEDLKFGLNVNVPFGLETRYDSDWIGRAMAIRSNLEVIDVGVNAAYRINPAFSVGAGVFVEYAKATLTSGYFIPGFGNAGFAKVDGDSWGVGYNIGALWEITDKTRAGVNYRSRVEHDLEGDVNYSIPIALAGLSNSSGSAELTLPDVLSVGIYHDINDQWAIMADAAWTNWSLFEDLNVMADDPASNDILTHEGWSDTYFVSLGTTYKHSDELKFQFGVAYDKGAAPDQHRTARIPDEDRFWLATGVEYKQNEMLTWNLSYSHIFVSDASLNESKVIGPAATPGNGVAQNLSGSYDSSIDIISLSASIKF